MSPFLPAAAATAGAAGLMAWAVRGRSSAVFGPSVWRGPANRKALALTFDDGPSEGTPALLEVLGQYGVPAAFFQVGANIDRLPGVAKAVGAAGHEIGNHSYAHPLFCFQSPSFMREDLARAQIAIEKHAGVQAKWFRAPFGVRWFGMRPVQRKLGLTGVMWTAIGYDWSLQADAVVRRLMSGVKPGAILCLHDGRELTVKPDIRVTVEAVKRLVPALMEQGYQFETLTRLLCPTN